VGTSSREAWQVLAAKRKYWTKVLSQSALDLGFWIMNNVFDFFSFWIDLTLSDTLLASLASMIFGDLAPDDIPPWNLAWNVELPTTEELLRGTLIKLEKKRACVALGEWLGLSQQEIEELCSKTASLELAIEMFFTPAVSSVINATRLNKGYYGKSRYLKAFYDPIAARDFIRSTLIAWIKKKGSYEEVRNRIEQAMKTLNIVEPVAADLFLRLRLVSDAKETCFTWDMAWWDRTYWGPEESHSPPTPVIETVDFYGNKVKLEYRALYDAQLGGWWDESYWDLFFFVPEDVQKEEVYKVWKEFNDTYLSMFRDAMVVNARGRIFVTPTAVANYQTIEERTYPWRSGRTETYALPYSQKLRIESIVKSIVTKMNPRIDSYTLRLYVSAALELYGRLYSPHKWGNDMYRSMSEDELKQYWISKWSSDGLDPRILEVIWDRVKGVIDRFGEVRIKDRIRFLRYRLRR